MTPITWTLSAVLGFMLIYGAGFYHGDRKATERYLPQLTVLKEKVRAADVQAKINEQTYKENEHEIAATYNDNINRIRAYYKRLLHTGDTAGSSVPAASAQGTDGTSGEQSACRPDIEFAGRCARDAVKVMGFHDYVTKNKIPVGD